MRIRFFSVARQVHLTRLIGEHTGIVTLSLNRPTAANSLSAGLLSEFKGHLDQIKMDE